MISTSEELREELLRSKKFLQWRVPTKPKAPYGRGQDFNYAGDKYTNLVVDEKHFTPQIWRRPGGFRLKPCVRSFVTNLTSSASAQMG
jgi:hypothetical protein